MPLRFEKIITRKKRFLDLLLLADEQESMIDRYLERGEMFVARDDGQVVAECELQHLSFKRLKIVIVNSEKVSLIIMLCTISQHFLS